MYFPSAPKRDLTLCAFFSGSPSGTGARWAHSRNVEGASWTGVDKCVLYDNKHDIFAAAAKPPNEWHSPSL
jgi:hypothetical protein